MNIKQRVCSAPNVYFYKCDVTSVSSVQAVGAQIREEHGEPTILVNNAGIGREGTILGKSESVIRSVFEVNTLAHWWTVREFLPAMIRANHGHIITIASASSFVGLGEMTDYCCSKASALSFHEGLTQEIRLWYKAEKVRTRYIFCLNHLFFLSSFPVYMILTELMQYRPPHLGKNTSN